MSEVKKPVIKKRGHKRKGTHGSLSQAGKMRQVLKQQKTFREEGSGVNIKKYPHTKKHKCPRVSNRRKYVKQIVLENRGNKNERE